MYYYAITKGITSGIFTVLQEVQEQIKKYQATQFKTFTSLQEAQNYMKKTTSLYNYSS